MIKDKAKLASIVKEWVSNDTKVRELQKQQRIIKLENKKFTEELLSVMRQNEIHCFDTKQGKIMYKTQKVKRQITKAALVNILNAYFEGNVDKANDLNEYILNRREVVTKESIKFESKVDETENSSQSI